MTTIVQRTETVINPHNPVITVEEDEPIAELCALWDGIHRVFSDCAEIRQTWGIGRGNTARYPIHGPNSRVIERIEAIVKQSKFVTALSDVLQLVDKQDAKERCAVLAAKIKATIAEDHFCSFPDAIQWTDREVRWKGFEHRMWKTSDPERDTPGYDAMCEALREYNDALYVLISVVMEQLPKLPEPSEEELGDMMACRLYNVLTEPSTNKFTKPYCTFTNNDEYRLFSPIPVHIERKKAALQLITDSLNPLGIDAAHIIGDGNFVRIDQNPDVLCDREVTKRV